MIYQLIIAIQQNNAYFQNNQKGLTLSQAINIRPFQKSDSDKVIEFISDIIVNEFRFKLEFDTLDSDILAICCGIIFCYTPFKT